MDAKVDGIYPVRVLKDEVLKWYITICDSSTMEHELKYNGLNKKLKYKVNDKKITDIAEILKTDKNQIIIYENFCQFLWSFSYSIIVFLDEAFIRPRVEENYNFKENELLGIATESIEAAFGLFSNPDVDTFFRLPNPEAKEYKEDKHVCAIEKAYCFGISFILLHEFGHQFLGHLEYEPESIQQQKKEEEDADDYAFSVLSDHFDKEYGNAIKVGIVISLITLIFTDETLSGGETHPDPHQRIMRIIEKMELEDNHNLWALAAVAFKLWAFRYNKPLEFPDTAESYKILFDKAFLELNYLKSPF